MSAGPEAEQARAGLARGVGPLEFQNGQDIPYVEVNNATANGSMHTSSWSEANVGCMYEDLRHHLSCTDYVSGFCGGLLRTGKQTTNDRCLRC